MEAIKFMYFWLNFSNKNNHLERILWKFFIWLVKHLNLMSFILSDSTLINDNEYLESLKSATEFVHGFKDSVPVRKLHTCC